MQQVCAGYLVITPLHMRLHMHMHMHAWGHALAYAHAHAHAHARSLALHIEYAHVRVHASHCRTMGAPWLQVQRRWATELDAALPPAAVDALLARELRRRRRRHRRQVDKLGLRRAPPSPLLRQLGGVAYFSACWAWGRWRADVGSSAKGLIA